MRPWTRRRGPGTAVAVIAMLALGAMAGLGVSADSPKVQPSDPLGGMTQTQVDAVVAAAHARNDQFLASFVASKQDPHKLPVVEVQDYAGPAASTRSGALALSDVVVQGTVVSVLFARNPSGGMPIATATLTVDAVVRGQAKSSITVEQLGGPVAQDVGGALAEDADDPLILPGDKVLLLLRQSPATGLYKPLLGVGVMFIQPDGTVVAEDANPFGSEITGRSLDQVLAMLRPA